MVDLDSHCLQSNLNMFVFWGVNEVKVITWVVRLFVEMIHEL